ncbi:MAG TPA: NAD(P)H-dependent glycerol-3-phosphate dehydrogenase [Opitutales bacterium]|nr:NAD(P)H-dependent glycerol-3-phosphate dehydrogenase [Opitutales bacterium]
MNVSILGAGAWGTALAFHLNKLGHTVTLVPRRFEQAITMASERHNRDYLPEIVLPHDLQIAHELRPTLMETEALFIASPTRGVREWAEQVKENLSEPNNIRHYVSLTKGLDPDNFLRPTEIWRKVLPDAQVSVLTGPTNALEVAEGKPTAMVLAGEGPLEELQEAISSESLRVYLSNDPIGAELAGALKNIYAIAAGCSDGLRLGDNAKAALLTRALAEMIRIGQSLGAEAETFYGLSGFGDLVATSHGPWSRNRTFGQKIGEGTSVEELLQNRKTVVEGYSATGAFYGLCQKKQIDAPILAEVYEILFKNKNPRKALHDLMVRKLTRERE